MTQVNNPNYLKKILPRGEQSRSRNNFDDQLLLFLDAIFRKTGGTDDITDPSSLDSSSISSSYALASEALRQMFELSKGTPQSIPSPSTFNCIDIDYKYTANDHDFINAKACALIVLPKYTAKNSLILIRNGDGSKIKIDGNGRNINGSLDGETTKLGTCLQLHYFIESDEWVAI